LTGSKHFISHAETADYIIVLAVTNPSASLKGKLGTFIVRRDNPHRTFLALGLLVGLLMVTFGHSGAQQGWFGAGQRELLDRGPQRSGQVRALHPGAGLPQYLRALRDLHW